VAKGTVKWFNTQKGYGFIEQADGGKDVFVHVNGLAPGLSALAEGQAVEYEVQSSQKGPQAVNVRPA
jgi:CspA family cold shock protein